MRIVDPFIQELEQEAQATRRVLERVPADKLDWKPHEKSFSMGQLALHVATTPGSFAGMLAQSEMELPEEFVQEQATSTDQIIQAFEGAVATTKTFLNDTTDEAAMGMWTVKKGDKVIMELPKVAAMRSLMLNHWYHHRAQLTVYLRLNDIPVPSVYGPTADENPFDM